MQGFLFSKPLAAIHLAEQLKPKPCRLCQLLQPEAASRKNRACA
jgi:hypothetical protein